MTSPVTVLSNNAMHMGYSTSSIADAFGNLQFYTDGDTVWNKNHVVMANGIGLLSTIVGSTNELPIIIKQPGNAGIYFIITNSITSTGYSSFYYSVVDMGLAAGLGSVTVQNTVLSPGNYFSGMVATRHCNGRDLWLITKNGQSGGTFSFHAFLVTASGISSSPVSSSALSLNPLSSYPSEFYIKISPDGKKIVIRSQDVTSLSNFDNNTGAVSNEFVLCTSNVLLFPAEFSPDATKLYGQSSLNTFPFLTQWDLCAGSPSAIQASRDSIIVPHFFADMQLAIDGKIYLSTGLPGIGIDVINSPNQPVNSCNYVSGGQPYPGNFMAGLPNFENGRRHAAPQTPPFTYTVSNAFGCQTASFTSMPVIQNFTTIGCSVVGYSLTSLAWNFGDPGAGAANTSTLVSPGHYFSALGTYTVKLILYYSCGGANDTISEVVHVNQSCISVANTGISCASPGSATVTSLIGTGPFTFTWMPTGQTGQVATNLSPGMYTVLVHDAATNITYTATAMIASAVPFTEILSATGSLPCYAASDGTAAVVTSGGSGNESYLWSNGSVSYTTVSPANLTAGSWTVTITDALTGCVADSVFTITQPPSLINIGVSPGDSSICVGSGLTLIGSSSGAPGIVYNWQPISGGNTATVSVSPSVTTTYVLTGSLNGCAESAIATVSVILPPDLNVSLNSATTCAEAFNGSANTITLTAGGALTYIISTPNDIYNSNPGGPITNLNTLPPHIPGVSTATVYGSNGVCTVSTAAVFTIIPNPTVSISNPTPVICAGQSFTYTDFGADSYTWSSSTPGQTIYTVGNITVFNATTNAVFSVFGGSLGCNSPTQSTTISVLPAPLVSINPNPAVTCSGTPVQLNAIGTGTQYSWYPSYWLSADNGATVSANPPSQQTYTVVASLNSCTSAAMVTVSLLPLPVPAISVAQQSVCTNDTIKLHGSGGLQYSWKGPMNSDGHHQDLTLKALSPGYSGIYTLTVTDYNLCSGSTTQSITVLSLPGGYFNLAEKQGCAPFQAHLSFQTAAYSSSVASLSWSVNNNSFTGNSFSYLFKIPGDYIITGSLTDIYLCTNTLTAVMNVYPKPQADFSFVPEHPVENFEEVQFTNQSVGATSFKWEFMNSQNTSVGENPVFLFEDAGTYPVALLVQNQWNCKDTAVKIITVAPDFAVYIPNTFTPDNDGKNDLYRPVFRGVTDFTFYIFNRWGEELFKTSDPASGWDGTYKGKACQEDTYVWKLVLSSADEKTNASLQHDMAGQVLLYR